MNEDIIYQDQLDNFIKLTLDRAIELAGSSDREPELFLIRVISKVIQKLNLRIIEDQYSIEVASDLFFNMYENQKSQRTNKE